MATQDVRQSVIDYAYGCGINPNVALAQINRESGFNPAAIGGDGERGIAQFMPGTWARFGYGPFENAHDVNLALDAWCAYMQFLLNRYNFNYKLALEGYNGGEGHVDNNTVSSQAQNYASSILAQAGADEWGNPWPDATLASGGQPPSQNDWSKIALYGGIALLAVVALGLIRD